MLLTPSKPEYRRKKADYFSIFDFLDAFSTFETGILMKKSRLFFYF